MMEDAIVIYRISRAPERRVFYVDVGNLPKNKAEEYMKSIMNRYKNKMVYDVENGEVKDSTNVMSMLEDFWMPRRDGCFPLDTKIPLLDGRDVELGQLIVEHKLGKTNWVYSVDPQGKIVPGKISWAGVTRNNADVMEITLSNGKTLKCTPDHKLILRTGEKIKAQDVVPGTSLMPFNTQLQTICGKEYTQVQHNDTEKYQFAHQMVCDYLGKNREKNEVIHHVDLNRYNNNPENLEIYDKKEHLKLHSKLAKWVWENGDRETHIARLSESGKKFFETEAGQKRKEEIKEFNKTCEAVWKGLEKGRENIKIQRKLDKETLSQEEFRQKWCSGFDKMIAAGVKKIKDDKEVLTKESFALKYGHDKISKKLKDNYTNKVKSISILKIAEITKNVLDQNINAGNPDLVRALQQEYPQFKSLKSVRIFLEHNGYISISDFIARQLGSNYLNGKRAVRVQQRENHSVVSIRFLSETMDVGTLTIDENHEYHNFHNFAVSDGIFVMNSTGTQVTTLPGGQSLGQIEDVDYFRRKLINSLNVPFGRMNNEQPSLFSVGRPSETTREEVNFSKFISKLRKRFSKLFYELLKTQLLLKRIIAPSEWEEIKEKISFDFVSDTFFSELKEADILRERVTTFQLAESLIGRAWSMEWARKTILKQNDEEIEKENKQIKKEREEDPNMFMNDPNSFMPGMPYGGGDMMPGQQAQRSQFPPQNGMPGQNNFDKTQKY
jgi:hypothetical protein